MFFDGPFYVFQVIVEFLAGKSKLESTDVNKKPWRPKFLFAGTCRTPHQRQHLYSTNPFSFQKPKHFNGMHYNGYDGGDLYPGCLANPLLTGFKQPGRCALILCKSAGRPICCVNGKCKGMLTPERLNILRKAFDRTKRNVLHDHVQPPPISFASELVGLIARKDISASKHTNKKIKDSFARILPSHFTAAFQKWALVTKEKWHPPLTMTPKSPTTGLSTQGIKCLGQTPMPSPPEFLGSPSAIPFTTKTPYS